MERLYKPNPTLREATKPSFPKAFVGWSGILSFLSGSSKKKDVTKEALTRIGSDGIAHTKTTNTFASR